MRRKSFKFLFVLAVAGIAVLVLRLLFMQIFAVGSYKQLSEDNMYVSSPIKTKRGLIMDCRGTVMAENKSFLSVRMLTYKCRDPRKSLHKLVSALRLSEKEGKKLFKRLDEDPEADIVIANNFDGAALARLAETEDHGEFVIETKSQRVYPLKSLAAHVVGYVGEVDAATLAEGDKESYYTLGEWIGKDGVELSHEHLLHGRTGRRIESVDVSGSVIGEVQEIAALPGKDIYLTIDARLQRRAEAALAAVLNNLAYKNGERSGGSLVAMETDTGYVRALVSLPSYDPNDFAGGISEKQFHRLIGDPCYPLLNRAVHSAYPPGSTFKLVTTAACLQEGIINPNSHFYCTGSYTVAGLPFNCFVRTGHGPLNLYECLGYSCDAVYYEIGPKLGVKRMDKYASAFGIGRKTGIDLIGETGGNLPTPEWKKNTFDEKWFPGDDANSAIGQGFVTASPLQMAVVTAAVANGGKVFRPSLLEKIVDNRSGEVRIVEPELLRRVPVKEEYLNVICEGMRCAVEFGTAVKSGGFALGMAGKTGTAENSPTEDNPRGLNHCWFTGYAPYGVSGSWRAPKMAITVCLEKSGGYGGEVAAPVAAEVLADWNYLWISSRNASGKKSN
ncbi:penicillin-binding protein 2 [bacterium]|nr:penicillin-binding protein 2 [bacterium]